MISRANLPLVQSSTEQAFVTFKYNYEIFCRTSYKLQATDELLRMGYDIHISEFEPPMGVVDCQMLVLKNYLPYTI